MLAKDEQTNAKSSQSFLEERIIKIQSLQTKLQRLLDDYLDQNIGRRSAPTIKIKLKKPESLIVVPRVGLKSLK